MSIQKSNLDFMLFSEKEEIYDFHCSIDDINDFLYDDAEEFRDKWLGITYLVYYYDELVAFFTISMDSIRIRKIEEDDRLGHENIKYYPCIKIGQMGVDTEHERKGIGGIILKFVYGLCEYYSKNIGCRFVTIDAEPTAQGFYETFDFTPLKGEEGNKKVGYYLDAKKIRK